MFVVVTDPLGDGLVNGLARPGGNITGFLTSEAAITTKMLDLLREVAPSVKRIAMLFNPDTAPGGGSYYYRSFDAAAIASQIQPIAASGRSIGEIERVVASLANVPPGGLIVMPDYFMLHHSKHIILHTAKNNVVLPPYSRTRPMRNVAPDVRNERGAAAHCDAA